MKCNECRYMEMNVFLIIKLMLLIYCNILFYKYIYIDRDILMNGFLQYVLYNSSIYR